MKRFFRIAGAAAAVLLALGVAWVWNAAFRMPAAARLPLPPALVDAELPAGTELLAASGHRADYDPLARSFEPQSRPAFCGVASAVVVLNALRAPAQRVTQAGFFTDSARAVRSPLNVTFAGMSLDELTRLLRAHGAAATAHFASESSLSAFRALALENLQTAGDFLLVNYQRSELGQAPMGHISPLAAYNEAADRFLILDVASYKYPPVWVTADALWRAMNTPDSASGRTRGFVTVGAGAEPRP